ncbi:MAG: sporulation transcription factor Spo0A [Clostridiales bacterium]|nr:sporulation transcription factor Spo0A [Clostridiales bacterium]
MQKKTVFLLQDTKEQNDTLSRRFDGDDLFEVIGMANDGITGISMIAEKKPQFVILEIVLSGYDGICVMEKIKELKVKTKFIVLSSFCREEIISKTINAGASYFMAKPYNFSVLRNRMVDLAVEKSVEGRVEYSPIPKLHDVTLDEKISKIFINVGIPPHIKGYSFLREGVKMAVEDPAVINSITKKLYPMIGEKYQTSASKVERAIRHAIEVAWNRGRIDSINSILGVRAYVGAEKPTNGEFIALIADKMLLEKA